MDKPKLVIIMGVSGCGKSTVASALANELNYEFIEADDFHSEENVAHMASGKPLSDRMREPWIETLIHHLGEMAKQNKNCVISFSGLRAAHRSKIKIAAMKATTFHLNGSAELIENRIKRRQGHFMPANLLASQFEALECPAKETHTHQLDIQNNIEFLVDSAKFILNSEQQ